MPDRTLKILFLPRWYPHRHDPMSGLFIQRQAEALAKWHHVVVLYVRGDPGCPGEFEIEFAEEEGITVIRVHYRIPDKVIPLLSTIRSLVNFYRAHFRGLELLEGFSPDIVHSHVLTRVPLVGFILARRFRVPHVISEHWSRYLKGNDTFRGWVRKQTARLVVRKAAAIVPVSSILELAMRRYHLDNPKYTVIPNVVDFPVIAVNIDRSQTPERQFIHISCFDNHSKNIAGLIGVVARLSEKRSDFHCLLVGDGPDMAGMKTLAVQSGVMGKYVFFPGLLDRQVIEDLLNCSDFSVLPSRYETFGTVIIESLACGTPVISTATGIASEVISDKNGIIVPVDDDMALMNAIDRMLDHCDSYNREEVRASIGNKFTSDAVGKQLNKLYSEILHNV